MSLPNQFALLALAQQVGENKADISSRHALCSARCTLKWTGVLPVDADFSVAFLPGSSFGCKLDKSSVDSTGVAPILYTRWKLDAPLKFDSRAQIVGSNVIEQGGLIPPNPIVGCITFPAAIQQADPSIVLVGNVVQTLLAAGTRSIWDIHLALLRGDLK